MLHPNPQRMLRLNVGGRDFIVLEEDLRTHPDSLLAKCLDPASPFRPHRSENGAFVFARDAQLFERVILPVLRTGYFDGASVDPFVALQELDYFCLLNHHPRRAPSPRALSPAEAGVLCRVMLARLMRTLPESRMGMQALFFAEEMCFDPLNPALNVGLFVTVLGPMFRSIALMEHQVFVQWSCFDAEVSYCNRSKSYRTASAHEPVHAFAAYELDPPTPASTAQWEVAACTRLEDAGFDRVANWMFLTPNRYLCDCREGSVEVATADGPCPLRVHLRMCYDLVQKCTLVDCTAAPTGPWTAYQSYLVVVVAGKRQDDGGGGEGGGPPPDLATLHDVLEWLKRDSRWVEVTIPAMTRLFDGASACSAKNQRFVVDDYLVYAIVCRHPMCKDRFVHEDPAAERKRLVGNLAPVVDGVVGAASFDMRVVNQSRIRRLCRMQLLALRID